MANKVQNPETDLMVETKGKLEVFFDKYGSKLLKALLAVTIIAVGAFVWVSYSESSTAENEQAAELALTNAINGMGDAESFVAVYNEYQDTKAGNTAAYMAGAAYLEANDLANAKTYLSKYENVEGEAGEIINALVYTLRGDIAVEENDLNTAIELYTSALNASDDFYSYSNAVEKLAVVYSAMGEAEKVQELYVALVAKYPAQADNYTKFIRE